MITDLKELMTYGEEAKRVMYINKVIDSLMENTITIIKTPVFEVSELFHRGEILLI